MFGLGVLKGMLVTFKNFILSYFTKERLTTVQYPEERIPEKERFRNFPFLIYDDKPEDLRCVSCDICAKECPPKCITIVRDKDEQGRPLKRPKVFDIDFTICMNCGICEEVCPFDAIFMDHEFELAEFGRFEDLNYHKEDLLKSAEYFAKIRPSDAARIDAKRREKTAKAQTETQTQNPGTGPTK
ncbi:MAG: NADH-quinone oxidoreductase subunit I [Candidatus Omnitrophica bacterium]|nr:NADH-quinone oxidoreductase subunit I [Candidatus Omnitrophota bacterium]